MVQIIGIVQWGARNSIWYLSEFVIGNCFLGTRILFGEHSPARCGIEIYTLPIGILGSVLGVRFLLASAKYVLFGGLLACEESTPGITQF